MKRKGKKIRRAEERAEKAVNSTLARKAARRAISSRSSAVRSAPFGSPRFAGPSQAVDFAPPCNQWLPVPRRSSETPAKPGNCYAYVWSHVMVSLITGDLNAFRVRVERKVITIAGD